MGDDSAEENGLSDSEIDELLDQCGFEMDELDDDEGGQDADADAQPEAVKVHLVRGRMPGWEEVGAEKVVGLEEEAPSSSRSVAMPQAVCMDWRRR